MTRGTYKGKGVVAGEIGMSKTPGGIIVCYSLTLCGIVTKGL